MRAGGDLLHQVKGLEDEAHGSAPHPGIATVSPTPISRSTLSTARTYPSPLPYSFRNPLARSTDVSAALLTIHSFGGSSSSHMPRAGAGPPEAGARAMKANLCALFRRHPCAEWEAAVPLRRVFVMRRPEICSASTTM
jgi:hypothetical protein